MEQGMSGAPSGSYRLGLRACRIREGRAARWTVTALLLALLPGCAQRDLDLGRGGLSAEDDARLSLAFSQVRALAPAEQVSGLAIGPRNEPAGLSEPELALTGEALSLVPGFQASERSRLRVAVYLDKSSYTRGHAKIGREGAPEETWRIVAYQLRGQADRDFEFTYLLADARASLRTLVLAGGMDREAPSPEGESAPGGTGSGANRTGAGSSGEARLGAGRSSPATRFAIEGALLLPDAEPGGKSYALGDWKTAYYFSFVHDEPVPPLYQALAAEAEDLFRQVERDVAEVRRLARRAESLPLQSAPAATGTPEPGAKSAPPGPGSGPGDPAELRRAQLESQVRQRAALAQARMVHAYQARTEADAAFAAYVTTNAYAWLDEDGRAETFDRWEVLFKQAAPLEERVAQLLPHAPEPRALEQARADSAASFAKRGNLARRPVRTKN